MSYSSGNMFRYITIVFVVLSTIISCTKAPTNALMIAAAANMQFAMNAMVESFEKSTGISCHVVISSSGKLTAQIKEGAPFDILVSANMKYPDDLFNSDKTLEPPRIYAYGSLVLWTPKKVSSITLEDLTHDDIQHIALANPKIAPYGMAAVETLKAAGIYDQVNDKLVYGESIAQVNQFLVSGAAEAGFTAKSVILSPKLQGQGSWIEISEDHYSPIAQGVVRIKRKQMNEAASQRFVDFMFSDTGRKILEEYGYKLNIK